MATLLYLPPDDGPGPVTLDNTDHGHYLVHGVYGYAPYAARPYMHTGQRIYVTLTWTDAHPYETRVWLMRTDGHVTGWRVARHLLRDHGEHADVAVWRAAANGNVWLDFPYCEHPAAVKLDGFWLARFLDGTDDITAPAAEWPTVTVPDDPRDLTDGGDQQ